MTLSVFFVAVIVGVGLVIPEQLSQIFPLNRTVRNVEIYKYYFYGLELVEVLFYQCNDHFLLRRICIDAGFNPLSELPYVLAILTLTHSFRNMFNYFVSRPSFKILFHFSPRLFYSAVLGNPQLSNN